MNQIAIDFAARCAAKAERVSDFDIERAADFILRALLKNGATPGEVLTDLARAAGFVPHDDRAFGQVFKRLAGRGNIRCVGYCERRKGHGTAGGRVWDAIL